MSGSNPPDVHREEDLPAYDFAPPLTAEHHIPDSFLKVWQDAHAAVKRHLYRGNTYVHPHYIQADLHTGATRAFWMDSLSAFFPGLLALDGKIDEAVETHLLFTALWTRFSALPERWSTTTGSIEGGLGWWGGRPEFIESTYHIYRATRDPWYLHVGEMTLRDIKRRCWTKCGWSGIQDVRTGEQNDRMESFFLGETAKYLHLLFDVDHPLNKLDAPFVFTTEGHPLIIPRSARKWGGNTKAPAERPISDPAAGKDTCPIAPKMVPLTISATAARADIFHAANLARLQHTPTLETLDSSIVEYSRDHPSIINSDIRSPTNYTYFPWTLPVELVPPNGMSSRITPRPTFDITFPAAPNFILTPGLLQRVGNGILVNGMAGLRLGMIQDVPMSARESSGNADLYRVHSINNIPLGKDEKIFLAKDILASVVNALDPNFTRVRDPTMLDLVVDVAQPYEHVMTNREEINETTPPVLDLLRDISLPSNDAKLDAGSQMKLAFGHLMQQVTAAIRDQPSTPTLQNIRQYIPAIIPSGAGVAPLPDVQEALGPGVTGSPQGSLPWSSIFVTGQNCGSTLTNNIPRINQVIVMQRGGCSFTQKLQNIPSFPPSKDSLQLVIVVSYKAEDGWLTRPLLDVPQYTSR